MPLAAGGHAMGRGPARSPQTWRWLATGPRWDCWNTRETLGDTLKIEAEIFDSTEPRMPDDTASLRHADTWQNLHLGASRGPACGARGCPVALIFADNLRDSGRISKFLRPRKF